MGFDLEPLSPQTFTPGIILGSSQGLVGSEYVRGGDGLKLEEGAQDAGQKMLLNAEKPAGQ